MKREFDDLTHFSGELHPCWIVGSTSFKSCAKGFILEINIDGCGRIYAKAIKYEKSAFFSLAYPVKTILGIYENLFSGNHGVSSFV